MEQTGWSWHELQNTPSIVVDEIAFRKSNHIEFTNEKREIDKALASKASRPKPKRR